MSPDAKKIKWAAEVLGLPKRASMRSIKRSYRNLIFRWHPDTSSDDPERCKEMTQQINLAYQIVLKYCESYEISFEEEDLMATNLCDSNYQSWWWERFGDDPLWAGTNRR
jgi:hypothetical protein